MGKLALKTWHASTKIVASLMFGRHSSRATGRSLLGIHSRQCSLDLPILHLSELSRGGLRMSSKTRP